MSGWTVHIERPWTTDRVRLFIFRRRGDNTDVITALDPSTVVSTVVTTGPTDEASDFQGLELPPDVLDALAAGIRAFRGSDQTAELAAATARAAALDEALTVERRRVDDVLRHR